MFVAELQKEVSKFDIPGEGQKLIVDEDLFQRLLLGTLRSVEFDGDWYKQTYKDVADAVSAGTFSSTQEHFIYYGYLEGRLPRRIPVDSAFYLSANPDVADAIDRGELTDAQQHFDERGHREGRLPSSGFRLF